MSHPDSHGESIDVSDLYIGIGIEKCLVICGIVFLFLLVTIIKVIELQSKAELRANKLQIALTTTQALLNEQNAANFELFMEQNDLKKKTTEERSKVREKEVTIQQSNRLIEDCLNELDWTKSLLTHKNNIISNLESKERATNSKLEESERKHGEVQTSLREMQDAYNEKRDAFSQLQVQLNERTRELCQKGRRISYLESQERETNSKLQKSEKKLGEAQTSLREMQDAYSELDLRELETYTQSQELKRKLANTKSLLSQKEAALTQLQSQQSARSHEMEELKRKLIETKTMLCQKEIALSHLQSQQSTISLEETREKIKCGVCFAAEKKVALKCGHMLCDGCLQKIRSSPNNHCPQCRKPIKSVIKIYF